MKTIPYTDTHKKTLALLKKAIQQKMSCVVIQQPI